MALVRAFFSMKSLTIYPCFSMTTFVVMLYVVIIEQSLYNQGSHRPEKYLDLEGFLEKSLKIKSALKSTGKITQKP